MVKLENRLMGAAELAALGLVAGSLIPLPEELLTLPALGTIGFLVGNKKIESLIRI